MVDRMNETFSNKLSLLLARRTVTSNSMSFIVKYSRYIARYSFSDNYYDYILKRSRSASNRNKSISEVYKFDTSIFTINYLNSITTHSNTNILQKKSVISIYNNCYDNIDSNILKTSREIDKRLNIECKGDV
jgi:hypothetical protein